MTMRPVLLSSCAKATTAAEARFRIDVPIEGRRGARVVALDDDAATIARRLARQQWNGARFFTLVAGAGSRAGTASATTRTRCPAPHERDGHASRR